MLSLPQQALCCYILVAFLKGCYCADRHKFNNNVKQVLKRIIKKKTATKKPQKLQLEDKVSIESGPSIRLQQIWGIWKSQPSFYFITKQWKLYLTKEPRLSLLLLKLGCILTAKEAFFIFLKHLVMLQNLHGKQHRWLLSQQSLLR